MKKFIITNLITVGVLFAQVPTQNTLTRVNGVLSFRLLSTGYIFEDDLDILQNPVRLHEIEGSRFYSSLSNLFGTSRLFKDTVEDFLTLGFKHSYSSTAEAFLFNISGYENPLPNYYGSLGHVEVDSLLREDTDGDGMPDRERTLYEREDASENFSSIMGYIGLELKLDNYSVGASFYKTTWSTKTTPPGTIIQPWGSFYYSATDYDMNTQTLLKTTEALGTASLENSYDLSIASLGGALLFENSSLDLLLGYRKVKELTENKSEYEIEEDLAPTISEIHVIRSGGLNYTRFNLPGNGIEATLHYKTSLDEKSTLHVYLYAMTQSQKMDGDMYSWTVEYTGTYDELPDGMKYTYRENNTLLNFSNAEKSTKNLSIFLKDEFELSSKVKFGIGVAFRAEKGTEKYTVELEDSSIVEVNDGDAQPLDPDDYTEESFQRVNYDSLYSYGENTFYLPVGVEIKPFAKKEFYLRIGTCFMHKSTDSKFTFNVNSLTPLTTVRVYGDSTTTLTTDDVEVESRTEQVKSSYSQTTFYYGAGFKIGERVDLDIMNFATLTDLREWKVQLVIKF